MKVKSLKLLIKKEILELKKDFKKRENNEMRCDFLSFLFFEFKVDCFKLIINKKQLWIFLFYSF